MAAKRAVDVLLSALLLLVGAPIIVAVWLSVAGTLGRPAFYSQVRPGFGGLPFRLYKFRTMTDKRDTNEQLLPDAERLTTLGRFLRRWSLDELPELWNVFKGEMSLVGPRPLLMEYLDLYSDREARRHEVRPGITGLAQISGRNDLPWQERLELDIYYVDNWSLWLDLNILARTIGRVISGSGVSQRGRPTAEKFTGTADPQRHTPPKRPGLS